MADFLQTDWVASYCRDSFYEFLVEFWDVIVPEPFVDNWHIRYLCDELQTIAERVFRGEPKDHDLIVNIPPGTTKSTIASIMFPAWVWTRLPTARFICSSHAYLLGMDLSRRCRDVVSERMRVDRKPSYADCFGDIELREDQNTKGLFVNTEGGSRQVATVGGMSPMGFHAHFLPVDDPIDPQKAVSEVELKNANDWMDNVLPSRVVEKEIVPTILIMQRLHQNDPTGHWLAKNSPNVKHICLPADCNEFEVKPPELAKFYIDGLLDPKRMPRRFLDEVRLKGEYAYASQYGQSPIPLGGGMFKADRIAIEGSVNESSIRHVCRYWDKAATSGGDGAYSVGVKLARVIGDHEWIVLDVVRGRWDSSTRENIIRQTAELDGSKVQIGIEQEPGSGGKESAEATIRRLAGFRVLADRPTGDKALRADPFSSQVNSGNVAIVRGEWNREYLEELRFFPNSTYKDQVDATSGAFNLMTRKAAKAGIL